MRFDKNRIILICIAAVLVIVLTVLVVVALIGLKELKNDIPQITTLPTMSEQVAEDQQFETPYGNLAFPGKWAEYLRVERKEEPDLMFQFIADLPSGKVQNLFDIRFGEALDPAVGQVVSDEGVAVGVHVTVHPFNPNGSWSVKETDAVTEMIESLDTVLAGLEMVPVGTPIPEVNGEEMTIDTPYCKLYFPSRWAEELLLSIDESDGYDLVFSAKIGKHETVKIFAVNFGGSTAMGKEAHTLLTENDVPYCVRARTFNVDTEGWSSVDESTVLAMQEDLNYLLVKLQQE